jgi:CMP-N,N'-diacetyllegionaminic acid synthase
VGQSLSSTDFSNPGIILGVIPARGGSKGIPRKNIRLLAGLPLIAYPIRAGSESRRLTRCIVSTNDREIAAIARDHGADVPFMRPDELAEDNSPTGPVLRHAVEWFEQQHNKKVFAVVTLQPTTPLCRSTDIDAAIDQFVAGQPAADSLISVCDAGEHHPLTLYYWDASYLKPFLSGLDPNTRRQDFPPVLWRNGAIYITRRDLLFARGRVASDRPLAYLMPRSRSANIDGPIDLAIAELMLKSAAATE